MPSYCCVPKCTSSGGHKFPTDPIMKKRWQLAVKRLDPKTKKLWMPSPASVVCSNHFKESDFKLTILGQRKRLKLSAVPSVVQQKSASAQLRDIRSRSRENVKAESRTLFKSDLAEAEIVPEVGCESEIGADDSSTESTPSTSSQVPYATSVGIQVGKGREPLMSLSKLTNIPKAIKYYTGFDNIQHFMFLFHVLGPAVHFLNPGVSLSPQNHLLITLMKLRQAKDDFELSTLFGVSVNTISVIFTSWVKFMYFQFKELDFWPSRQVIQSYMPDQFRASFPNTRVILDGTEVPIQKPSQPGPQRETFSTYKNKNTLKVVVGCTPRGTVSFISDAYGGSASDRQIIERSDLCRIQGKFDAHDSIMADRGIMVQDLFAPKNVKVNTPTMLKGKSQLDAETVVRDRRVASKRIHIERVIGLAKTYKILKKDLPGIRVGLGNMIVNVCFNLVNFRSTIVSKNA